MNQPNQEKKDDKEIRGVWINYYLHSDVLISPTNITNALDFLKQHGFNYVFPAVWDQGLTAFSSDVMKEYGFPEKDPFYKDEFDPLKTIITEGRNKGIKVIPWLEYGFMASAKPDGEHILKKYPKWAAEWSDSEVWMNSVNSFNGEDIQKFIEFTLNSEEKKEGHAWMNSLNQDVQDFMQKLILEIVEKYSVIDGLPGIAGIQGDDHFPAMPMYTGYDTKTQEDYKKKHGKYPPLGPKFPSKRKEDPDWDQWVKFRADKLTEYLTKLSEKVKQKANDVKKEALEALNKEKQDNQGNEQKLTEIEKKINDLNSFVVSMAPSPYPFGRDKLMQDSDAWVKIVDLFHPQFYKSNVHDYKDEVDKMMKRIETKDHPKKYVPGIAFRANSKNLTPEDIVECVRHNRIKGLGGQVFFDYEGLREDNDAMAKALLDYWEKNP
jgi:uncharacterized lipoprotein YddW (UPF0748 family)